MRAHDPASPKACCCGSTCTDCSGATPSTLTVTVSGVTACGPCQRLGASTNYYTFTGSPNGTWSLTQNPDGCSWSYTYDASECLANFYPFDSSCTGTPTTGSVVLTVFSNRRVTITGNVSGPPLLFVASSHVSLPADCAASYTATNGFGAINCGQVTLVDGAFWGALGYGGTADVSNP